jgi:murein DD-endopeptidase MepM/ murein hydrolase activator NlpD
VDIQAPLNGNVYACTDGEVYRVHDGTGGHPYGLHIRIRHAGGYSTIYAHLNRSLVYAGQEVRAGQRIGLADSTGNATGQHLHLTLKKAGATEAGLTTFPRDIMDPTPFLVFPADRRPPAPPTDVWPYGQCLIGLHGRVGGPMQEPDWAVVKAARVEALKLISLASPDDVDRAHQINPKMLVMVRLFADFRNRVVPPPTLLAGSSLICGVSITKAFVTLRFTTSRIVAKATG